MAANVNPVRKMVIVLQNAPKTTSKSKRRRKIYVLLQNNAGELEESITSAKTELENLGTMIKTLIAKTAPTEQDLKEHQSSRADAKEAMAQAIALREKEDAAYATFEADLEAINAIESGMAGFFIQTPLAKKLQNYAAEKADLPDRSRQVLISFLSGPCFLSSSVMKCQRITQMLLQKKTVQFPFV